MCLGPHVSPTPPGFLQMSGVLQAEAQIWHCQQGAK